MRLIDADTLVKDLSYLYTKNHIPVDMRARKVLTTIMEQPTAYDVDKVVEQLEQKMKRARDKEQENTSEYFEGEADGFEFAIEIVKKGGSN